MLPTRTLGTQHLRVSVLGLGLMGMSHAYGTAEERDERESIATIHRAIELGVTFFDTAEVYGPYTNEELLARAFEGQRDRLLLVGRWAVAMAQPMAPYPMAETSRSLFPVCAAAFILLPLAA